MKSFLLFAAVESLSMGSPQRPLDLELSLLRILSSNLIPEKYADILIESEMNFNKLKVL